MSIFIKARFYEQSNHYVCVVLRYDTNDLQLASGLFGAMRCGWVASGRGDMVWDEVLSSTPCLPKPDIFVLPEDVKKLRDHLERFKGRGDITESY